MTPGGAAGRGPGAKRPTPSGTTRSRAASPSRRTPRQEDEQVERQTAYTARAAILLLALASVIVAIAVPLKIWLGQRSNVASLAAQTHQTELKVAKLNALDKQWHQPSYIEAQARDRLHYVVPGQKTYIVLGRPTHSGKAAAAAAKRASAAAAAEPFYSEFWQSDRAAGQASATK
jgi:cell division protein FtsB